MKFFRNNVRQMPLLALSALPLLMPGTLHADNKKAEAATPKTGDPLYIEKEDTLSYRPPVNLDEIVVTGQGNAIQKRRLSTEVTTVSAKELNRLSTSRLDQQLQNLLPNVQMTLSNGQPGTTSMIKARGLSSAFTNSTPVIYVDGVRLDNLNTGSTLANKLTETLLGGNVDGQTAASGSIADIPMENIERIEYVPGGAATTLYGSDAGNGVIQIFTKKGGDGRFQGSAGIELGVDVANSQFYYFDRTKDLLHQTGFEEKYRLSMSGGNNRNGFSLGANMSHNTGTLIHDGNESKKYELRFGSHVNINSMLNYQNSFGFSAADFKRSRNGNEGSYTGLWFAEGSAAAYFSYTDEQGKTQKYNADIDAADAYQYAQMKAFVSQAEALQDNKESVKRFQTSQQIVFTPTRDLTFKGVFGIDYRYNTNKNIETNAYLIHTQIKPKGTNDAGSISNYDRNYFGVTADINGQYKFYDENTLSNILTGGFQFFNTHDHQSVYIGKNVRDGAKVMTGAGVQIADEWMSYMNSYGFYLQDNFGFMDRYFLDCGLRVDYNTAFGDNVGWQAYPKVGLSYILSDEPFLQTIVSNGWIGSLKLFANYGIAGNYPPAFEYQKTIDVVSYQGKQAGTFGNYGNDDLGPEKKHTYEVGLVSSLLKGYVSLGFTYYYSLTKGALFYIPTLPSSGQNSNYLANIGKIRNKGVEINLGVNFLKSRDWNGFFNLSLNTNDNIVKSTGNAVPFAIGGFSSRTIQTVVEEGKPVGFLRGAKTTLNADGTVNRTEYLQDLGSTIPTLYGNFSLGLSWKKLSFYASGDYQAGSYVHSFDRQFRFARGLKDKDVPEAALKGTTQAKAWLDMTNFFVEKADFLKIRHISLDYTFDFPGKLIHQLQLGAHVYNPFVITGASVDPEAVISGARTQGAVATGGLNYSTFSLARQYVLSAQIQF